MNNHFIKYISNSQHYDDVLARIETVRHTLWIGTADIKDAYVKSGGKTIPLQAVLSKLVKRGVTIRLIHAKEPGTAFREDFDKYPMLWDGMERLLCPRVHFKIIVFDMEVAYIGSANLTGAGIGMKSENRRNFEAGILTNDPLLVESTANQFDGVWLWAFCKKCGRKDYCGEHIV